MESTEKQKSMRILPKVEHSHYISGLENILNDYADHVQWLQNENPEILRLMQVQINLTEGQERLPVRTTILAMYSMLRQAAKNNRLPMVSAETLKKIISTEYPTTNHELKDYVNDNYKRINGENPLIAYLLLDIIKQYESRPNAKVSVLLSGITLYRVLEEQTLNTQ